ncbi:MAG: SH3 domain-containing protein [Microcystis aeruginosa Ma_QC_Ch_20071001_S25]|jgi:outer membrane biosynthesis protein TonB|uniref:SH3 domain-containing protein n=1 Tax=Microcystis aeruginosa Ma_QC_Ch_20071001_S25D TaxID=2486250 RepID=A0A552FP55_MICAE|nr:MAG: SH3 domain-containing protein [Microcystis aeruginosa Ma_QC_Ch_20071001_S25D]TRU53477.1 MAG: SH3 domain-containing protein [Microcystis aeruginosa Ma_QC_Ch_20071001_S25]TRU62694.1 MAG: SH3 domain-containing protein [Microcystis aeruginosa Ma_QC_Ch_20071001_M135]
MKRLSGLLQFMLGFVMGVAILVGGATAVAYMLLSGMNSNPPKPVFTEEKKEETKEEKAAKPQAEVKESPKAAPAPKASPKPSPEARKRETTSSGYQARVTWQSGLSLRSEPTSESTRLGGLDYNTKVSVVGTSSDGQWQRIRLSDGREGWIKAGNISRVE